MSSQRILSYIQDMVNLSPRQGKGEIATFKYLAKQLNANKVPFVDQVVETTVPVTKKAKLVADGKEIECRGTGLESGVIEGKDYIISSLMWGDNDFYHPSNINFNPRCEKTVSMAIYFKHASLAINKFDLPKILNAKNVKGEVKVEPYTFDSHNLLVGNLTNPKKIIFTHYDGWETGAIDNASGTATMLDVVITQPELLDHNLFVFAGNEEVSYDEPIFWGKGYRQFQDQYDSLMEGCKGMIVIDCVGYSPTEVAKNTPHVFYAFPVRNYERFTKKSAMISGSMDYLMNVYHADADDMSHFKKKYIDEARQTLIDTVLA